MRLATITVFAAGYVIGARAGRERYAQIVKALERTSERLDEYSSRHRQDREDDAAGERHGDA